MVDPFEQPLEDLGGGRIKMLSHAPAFTGTYSRIYRGKIRENGELVAVKVLNAINGTALPTMLRKVKRERRTWGALKHPNILPLYGFADDEDLFQPFGALISPWRRAGDASKFLSDHGASLTHEDRMKLVSTPKQQGDPTETRKRVKWQDVMEGVNYLHSFQPVLIHGDLKPLNILIDDDGRAQLCDFGLVRIFLDEGGSGMTTTTTHTGTARYLACELVVAGEDARPTTASDIYAVGCVGLEFVFSQAPYRGRKSNFGGIIFMDIRAGDPPAEPPTDLSPEFESVWRTLEDCWNIDPSNRPSAASLLAWFDGHAAGLFRQPIASELASNTAGATEQDPGSSDEDKQLAIDGVRNVAGSGLAGANSPDITQLSANIDETINVDTNPTPDMNSTPELLISSSQPTATSEGGLRKHFTTKKGVSLFGRERPSIVLAILNSDFGAFFF